MPISEPEANRLYAAYLTRVFGRLDKGAQEYGNTSFDMPEEALGNEILEELEDFGVWAFVLWTRVVRSLGIDLDRIGVSEMNESNQGWLYSHGANGLITDRDVEDLRGGTRRVFDLMGDGAWHTAEEIDMAAGENGIPARGGMRRMRDLRDVPGVTILKKHLSGRRWEYRMVVEAVL